MEWVCVKLAKPKVSADFVGSSERNLRLLDTETFAAITSVLMNCNKGK